MKYINCCILLACLINYCVVIVWLQSLQPHVPTPAAAAAPLWQSVPEKITSCSSSLHMPGSCFFYGRPRNLCASHLHPSATILASVNWVCSPISCLLAEFSSWPCLHVLSWRLPKWLCPPCCAAVWSGRQEPWLCAGLLVLPGCTLEADTAVELLVPTLQGRGLVCMDSSALLSTWHCCWNDSCTIV